MPNRWLSKATRTTLGFSLLMLVLAACGQNTPQTMLDPATDSAREIYWLSSWLFWLGVIVFVFVEIWLIVSIFKFRQKQSDEIPAQMHGNTTLEITWTIIPAIIAIFIFVLTFSTIQKIENKPAAAAGNEVKVEVIGHQWWWEFRYPEIMNSDGQPLVTANELWIPAGSYVDLTMWSVDVIHDFWIPGLAGKRDVMPNHRNKVWFKTDDVTSGQPKVFWGQCAEYCGGQHAYMKMRVVVANPADFDRWKNEQSQPAVNVNAPQTFATKGCIGCHAIRGAQGSAPYNGTGPDLTHFGSRMTLAAGTLDNNTENLHAWLDDPNAVKRGNIMTTVIKPDTLTPQEVDELVTYLLSLNPGTSLKGQ